MIMNSLRETKLSWCRSTRSISKWISFGRDATSKWESDHSMLFRKRTIECLRPIINQSRTSSIQFDGRLNDKRTVFRSFDTINHSRIADENLLEDRKTCRRYRSTRRDFIEKRSWRRRINRDFVWIGMIDVDLLVPMGEEWRRIFNRRSEIDQRGTIGIPLNIQWTEFRPIGCPHSKNEIDEGESEMSEDGVLPSIVWRTRTMERDRTSIEKCFVCMRTFSLREIYFLSKEHVPWKCKVCSNVMFGWMYFFSSSLSKKASIVWQNLAIGCSGGSSRTANRQNLR